MAPSPLQIVDGIIRPAEHASLRIHPIPDELYLREVRELELDKEASIARFVKEFGWLGVAEYGWPPVDLPVPYEPELSAAVRAVISQEERTAGTRSFELVDEFRRCIEWFRDLTGIAVDGQRDGLEQGPSAWESTSWMPRPRDREMSLMVLEMAMNKSLRWGSAQISVSRGARSLPQPPRPVLLTALIIQLFNHLAEGAEYKQCANETHAGLFVRQRDTRKSGERTKGVLYCSRACAQAQAQREYRRRQAG